MTENFFGLSWISASEVSQMQKRHSGTSTTRRMDQGGGGGGGGGRGGEEGSGHMALY